MNKMYLSLLGAFLAVSPCKSQTLSDGKVWNFVQRMYEHDDIERAYTVTVRGDTVANGLLCKKLIKVYQDSPNVQTAYAVFEKDSKVYGVYGEENKLLMDFNLAVGDKANEVGTVISVDYIAIDNVQHKRITVDYGTYNYQSYLVEGVGLSSTKYSAKEQTSYYDVLVSVYENGKCIFKDNDFTQQTTGIERSPQIEEKDNSTLYDLFGRQVLVPQKGHIYIKGGQESYTVKVYSVKKTGAKLRIYYE